MTALLLVAVTLTTANVVLMFRWRTRNQRDLDTLQYEMRRVHQLVGAGHPPEDEDRRTAQLDVEQYVFTLPNCVFMALISVRLSEDHGSPEPAATAFRIVGYVLSALAILLFIAWCRHVVKARRQGIHPRPPWR